MGIFDEIDHRRGNEIFTLNLNLNILIPNRGFLWQEVNCTDSVWHPDIG